MTHQPAVTNVVIIGGSIAGLLAARVLAAHAERVTMLERDTLPTTAAVRRGVPQARHAHALLGRGQQILEDLFPGLTQDLIAQGAAKGHGRFFSGGGYHCPIPDSPPGLFVSRPCLEHAVRTRVLVLPNVQMVEGCDAQGLLASEDRSRVTGVRTDETEIPADLVVDASGRGSRLPAWLTALGYPAPDLERVTVDMGYSTRHYRREPDHLGGDLVVNIAPSPSNTRACGMLAQEGERWIVTLAGYHGDHPPTDDAGYLDFARRLPVPDVYDLIRTATPLGDPVPYRFRANQRYHYETVTRFPDGLLVIGDAIASFTPIYGQGMTVAAQEAFALQECLAAGWHHLARRYFPRASAAVDVAWTITVGNDRRLTGDGARDPKTRFLTWYLDRLQRAARHDARLALAFRRVGSLFDAPPSLLRPGIALRVLWGTLHEPTPAPVSRPEPSYAVGATGRGDDAPLRSG